MASKFWAHHCKESIDRRDLTLTSKNEPCNWCDVTEEDIALTDMHDDHLVDPRVIDV